MRTLLPAIALFGLVIWEVLWNNNGGRWQVWSVIPCASVWAYVGAMRLAGNSPLLGPGDPSWWWLITLVVCPLSLLPYAVFHVHENMGP